MRLVILVAAFGVMGGVVTLSPTLSPAVEAQSVSEQQTVQAQLIALAQAGNWAAFNSLVDTQVAAGRAGMLATIAGNISTMGLTIADTDTSSAVALSLAAMAIADNATVYGANPGIGATVGNNVGQVKAKIVRRSPAGAAALASAAARSGAPGLMVAYNAGQSGTQQTGSTTTVVTVVRQTPPRPTTPVVPIIVEPNPDQAGSPT
ncbi:hypothetical protein [Kordiimonas sp.]|uniref:hypothetical protein n=1 Tax=Kordiimonas sp. TaxID=1970157 RepID=UPI003A93DB0A